MRAWEAAKRLNIPNREFLARADRLGHHIEMFMTEVTSEILDLVKNDLPNPISSDEICALRPVRSGARTTCRR